MQRPENVPLEAEWSEEDDEWVLGTRDADGEYHGEVHYWRPDGSLVSIANQHHGEWHGECRRFHENGEPSQIDHFDHGVLHGLRTWIACAEPTTEVMHTPQMSEDIWRAEVVYDRGRPTAFRWFLRDGTEVEMNGSPVVQRPDGVPEGAVYNKRSGCWIAGTWDPDGKRDGVMRVYRTDGSLLSVENYTDDIPHGPHEVFYEDGTLRLRRHLDHGELTKDAEFYFRDGSLARRGTISNGTWDGPVTDYDRSGEVIGTSTAEPLSPPTDLPALNDDERVFVELLGEDPLPTLELSAVGLARVVAIAWGGADTRHAARARAARAFARAHPALCDTLAAVGLDTAPRLLTTTRLERLCALCDEIDAVDGPALRRYLAIEGGVGATAALSSGGPEALAFLRDQMTNNRLDLERKGLAELPQVVRYLPALENLELANNRLTTLPSWISDLAFLRRLQLNGNRLETLPNELTRMRELRTLYLADNGLDAVPEVVTRLEELEVLNLSDNQLSELPSEFGDLPRLRQLWLNDNPLESLPRSFGGLPLTFLHLGGVPWTEPPDCLWNLESLETLWIASRSLQRLPPEVARLTNLKELMIWYSNLTKVPDVLFEMTHLEQLRISHNPLPDGTIELLKEALPDCTVY